MVSINSRVNMPINEDLAKVQYPVMPALNNRKRRRKSMMMNQY